MSHSCSGTRIAVNFGKLIVYTVWKGDICDDRKHQVLFCWCAEDAGRESICDAVCGGEQLSSCPDVSWSSGGFNAFLLLQLNPNIGWLLSMEGCKLLRQSCKSDQGCRALDCLHFRTKLPLDSFWCEQSKRSLYFVYNQISFWFQFWRCRYPGTATHQLSFDFVTTAMLFSFVKSGCVLFSQNTALNPLSTYLAPTLVDCLENFATFR